MWGMHGCVGRGACLDDRVQCTTDAGWLVLASGVVFRLLLFVGVIGQGFITVWAVLLECDRGDVFIDDLGWMTVDDWSAIHDIDILRDIDFSVADAAPLQAVVLGVSGGGVVGGFVLELVKSGNSLVLRILKCGLGCGFFIDERVRYATGLGKSILVCGLVAEYMFSINGLRWMVISGWIVASFSGEKRPVNTGVDESRHVSPGDGLEFPLVSAAALLPAVILGASGGGVVGGFVLVLVQSENSLVTGTFSIVERVWYATGLGKSISGCGLVAECLLSNSGLRWMVIGGWIVASLSGEKRLVNTGVDGGRHGFPGDGLEFTLAFRLGHWLGLNFKPGL